MAQLSDWLASWRRPYQSAGEIAAYQSARLRRIVRHAAVNVPYYRKLFAASGLEPGDITSIEDLTKIPVSSKSDFTRLAMDERLAGGADAKRLVRHMTSGSTGVPLDVRRTRIEELRVHFVQFRSQLLAGLRPGDRRVFLGDAWDQTPFHRAGLFRLEGLGSNTQPEEALRRLRVARPEIIVGHPSLLELILRSLRRDLFESIRPRLLFTGAEMLSPHARKLYETTFRCPVVDFYGAHEVGHIAWQCRRCGLYHTCDDSVMVEVLRGGQTAGPGEDGEIVVTSLHSEAMPIIRYRLGDIVRRPRKAPVCGSGFGAIESIQGRSLDYLELPDGCRINPYVVVEKLAQVPGMVCFQVAQDESGKAEIKFESQPGRSIEPAVNAACRELFPPGMQVALTAVPRIPLSPGGKRRYIQTRADGAHG